MSVTDEIREIQHKALKDMSMREKLSYFWDYYKVHFLVTICGLGLLTLFIYQYVTNKDYAFYAAFVNAHVYSEIHADTWEEEFTEFSGIDTDKYEVAIDTGISLSEDMATAYSISSQEKMLALLQIGEIHTIVSDTETFEKYAQYEYFYPLDSLLSPEDYEKYKEYFYYTDMATIDMGDDDTFHSAEELSSVPEPVINHHDPSTMETPVAVGLFVNESSKIKASEYYAYLSDQNVMFQGYPSEAVFGVPITVKDPSIAIKFLTYLDLAE